MTNGALLSERPVRIHHPGLDERLRFARRPA